MSRKSALMTMQSLSQGIGEGNRITGRVSAHVRRLLPEEVNETKKRTEITIERNRLLVISRRKLSVIAWCVECGARRRMITADEAAKVCGVSSRTIYRRVEAGGLHFMETPEGRLLICSNSLGW